MPDTPLCEEPGTPAAAAAAAAAAANTAAAAYAKSEGSVQGT